MNGTYNVTVRTPVGIKKGTVTFVNQNGMLRGSIRAMGYTIPFRNGRIDGNAFEITGNYNAGFWSFRYKVKGTVEGDTLEAVATTSSGTFHITGTRVGAQRTSERAQNCRT